MLYSGRVTSFISAVMSLISFCVQSGIFLKKTNNSKNSSDCFEENDLSLDEINDCFNCLIKFYTVENKSCTMQQNVIPKFKGR